MANSASDARSSEQELRQKLIGARAVDVMIAVGPNMFYTVTLPCTLCGSWTVFRWPDQYGNNGSATRPTVRLVPRSRERVQLR